MKNFNNKKKNKHSSDVATYYSMIQTILNDWIVDFGCTNHICFENDKFKNFHKYKKDAVVIGDNSILEVQRIERMLIHEKVFKNVLYVSKLRINLLFVIQVARKEYSFEFDSYSWCIKKGLATLIKGLVKDDLYTMDQVPSKMCLATNVCSKGNLWHHQLGNLNHKSIHDMKNQELQ